tara:strand:- start:1277 stop:1765 length:489 start_codon:yes stop_codon:yes gene_type:complete
MHKIKVTWKTEDFINLEYISKGGYSSDVFALYSQEIYKKIINNDVYHLPNPMPAFVDTVLKNFDYRIKAPAFNRMSPGNVLPLHKDKYKIFMNQNNIKDINSVYRFIIFLEDSKPGHFMQIGNKIFSQWQSGDYVKWQGQTLHAAYNLGSEDRYTLQVTCIK